MKKLIVAVSIVSALVGLAVGQKNVRDVAPTTSTVQRATVTKIAYGRRFVLAEGETLTCTSPTERMTYTVPVGLSAKLSVVVSGSAQ